MSSLPCERNRARRVWGLAPAVVCIAGLIANAPSEASGQEPVFGEPTASLVDEFFTLTSEFESPSLRDRDTAEEELSRRFVEFEPVWQDRAFLTDGEISYEARQRFEVCEARWRRETFDRAHESFRADWRLEAGAERGVARVSWSEPLRVVYLVPLFETFLWRDSDSACEYRPDGVNSAPEILPAFDEQSVEVETRLRRADPTQDVSLAARPTSEPGVQGSGRIEVLAGLDLRELSAPVATDEQKRRTYRSGELSLIGPVAQRREKGGLTVRLGLEYDFAFDAFDSHRVWLDAKDFTLKTVGREEKFEPRRLRFRARNSRGVDVELDFGADSELENAALEGRAELSCRAPRFLARMRIAL